MRIGDDSRLSDRRVKEWFLLEQARRESERAEAAARPVPLPVVTISRQFGAGGHSVALKLVENLGTGWQVWDKEIIEEVARSAQVRSEMVQALDEHTQSWMDQMMHSLFNVKMIEPLAYRHHLVEVLLALGQQGRKIIIGRGANFVLPEALNVRLCAPLDFRVQAIMVRESIPREEATKQVHAVDEDRTRFTRRTYSRDIGDVEAYDLTLQTQSLGFETAVTTIVAAARSLFGAAI